jgi:hypothetical protein
MIKEIHRKSFHPEHVSQQPDQKNEYLFQTV